MARKKTVASPKIHTFLGPVLGSRIHDIFHKALSRASKLATTPPLSLQAGFDMEELFRAVFCCFNDPKCAQNAKKSIVPARLDDYHTRALIC